MRLSGSIGEGQHSRHDLAPSAAVRRSAVGIAPVLVALALYNRYFFGSALRFGYVASTGPLVSPGFHQDPTGQFYGPIQALGYTSADLVTLSLYLLETPIPAVVLVGLFFLLSPRLTRGELIIALWALLPVIANVFYWHHGNFMGPRMLNEAAPAWVLLTAVAAVGLVRRIQETSRLAIIRRARFGDDAHFGLAQRNLFSWAPAFGELWRALAGKQSTEAPPIRECRLWSSSTGVVG